MLLTTTLDKRARLHDSVPRCQYHNIIRCLARQTGSTFPFPFPLLSAQFILMKVLTRLEMVFDGYEDCEIPPALFILLGNFASVSYEELSQQHSMTSRMRALHQLILKCPRLVGNFSITHLDLSEMFYNPT